MNTFPNLRAKAEQVRDCVSRPSMGCNDAKTHLHDLATVVGHLVTHCQRLTDEVKGLRAELAARRAPGGPS